MLTISAEWAEAGLVIASLSCWLSRDWLLLDEPGLVIAG